MARVHPSAIRRSRGALGHGMVAVRRWSRYPSRGEGVDMADRRAKRIAEFIKPLRVAPGSKVKLARDFDPRFKAGVTKKKQGVDLLEQGVSLLSEYQARLAAQDQW